MITFRIVVNLDECLEEKYMFLFKMSIESNGNGCDLVKRM